MKDSLDSTSDWSEEFEDFMAKKMECRDCPNYIDNNGAACDCGCADDCVITGERVFMVFGTENCVVTNKDKNA